MDHGKKKNAPLKTKGLLDNRCTRRSFLKGVSIAAAAGSAGLVTGGCGSEASSEESKLKWQEFFKKNYRLMTQQEKDATVARLERLSKLQRGLDIQVSNQEPHDNVLFGYAFNITRCKGYMDCVEACVFDLLELVIYHLERRPGELPFDTVVLKEADTLHIEALTIDIEPPVLRLDRQAGFGFFGTSDADESNRHNNPSKNTH